MTIWSRMRRLDQRVFPTNRRPTQRSVARASGLMVCLMAVLIIATLIDDSFGVPLGVIAFSAGLWSGRLQEAVLAANGRGIIVDNEDAAARQDE